MKGWVKALLATLALAVLIHAAVILTLPYVVMGVAMGMDTVGGAAPVNEEFHAPRVDASLRDSPKPSPDLLYTICNFDVSERPLRVTAELPEFYWSFSLYARNADNVFVVNDREVEGSNYEAYVVGPSTQERPPDGANVISSPSDRGLALFRTLIPGEDYFQEAKEVQRQSGCD
jgi:uncharacterized membrane protein